MPKKSNKFLSSNIVLFNEPIITSSTVLMKRFFFLGYTSAGEKTAEKLHHTGKLYWHSIFKNNYGIMILDALKISCYKCCKAKGNGNGGCGGVEGRSYINNALTLRRQFESKFHIHLHVLHYNYMFSLNLWMCYRTKSQQ